MPDKRLADARKTLPDGYQFPTPKPDPRLRHPLVSIVNGPGTFAGKPCGKPIVITLIGGGGGGGFSPPPVEDPTSDTPWAV